MFQNLGLADDMEWKSREDMRKEFQTERFEGGIFESNTGILNPCKHVRELKRLAEDIGVEIYERTVVNCIEDMTHSVALIGEFGRVSTDKLVLATNAYTRDLNGPGGIKNKQIPIWSFQIVTEQISDELWKSIGWENRQSFGDNRQMLHYFRPTNDGRIIIGGGDILFNKCINNDSSPSIWAHCEQHLKWIYPQLKHVKVAHRWGGPVSGNFDFVPEIGYLKSERIIYSTGCFGHGVSLSHLNGRTIADLINNTKTDLTDFWIINRKSINVPGQSIGRIGGATVRHCLKIWDKWEERSLRK